MTPPAAVRETHVGVVVLVGDRAYKAKKPVRTAFLDFSTASRRSDALQRELDLNRRVAPDVYLGIARLTGPSLGEQTADGGEPVLVMRRMPDERRLAERVRSGADVGGDLRAVARLLAAFHARAERSAAIDADGGAAALTARWTANLAELVPYRGRVLAPEVVDDIGERVHRFLAGRGPLLADRVAQHRIVDGHGDLIAEDVFCLDDGPRVLDCLEFDDRLRHVDGLDDAAFLAMDLEHLGRPDLAATFLDDYAEFSGDPAPTALRHHYVAYRAVVRAKVACLRHDQGGPAAAADAAAHAALALHRLEAGEVRLVLVGGLPGTGKTTLAHGLADRFGAVVLSSDRVRKELAGVDPESPAAAAFGDGLYRAEHTDRVYAELLRRAEALLARGESVVLDASWTAARHRDRADAVARRAVTPLIALRCSAEQVLARRRILERTGGPSDATPEVAAAMAAAADPWPDAVVVPTSSGPAAALDRASAAWQER
ncbi:AAA family ATPase [Pseudonocardia sp. KRD-184]|uniref:AAA family ATPase n=1 Tax=Pseudonocardia oceani TaxID=2792013 RepID=A0ABS6UHN3_9PSEU|nr:AAA family ATPase [Pseudonocardia oceani]MBW0092635.1 AAA family ATPase [Pseudonocardia oceani]MBW0098836.1 AAA family ATPase [Pseudonocardia oceani]MBW0111352.1 AAA family ATPase [Pseudonocardia oceani]MBW0122076.1 AAA family ATPase [Pseudonocardia oceani]MBW0131748.1 AAA family ATPase [Pseudonocardia oceani]